jgi:hypothetical protein
VTPEEQSKMEQLCILIQSEEDHRKVSGLVKELNELLESKGRCFSADRSKDDPVLGDS